MTAMQATSTERSVGRFYTACIASAERRAALMRLGLTDIAGRIWTRVRRDGLFIASRYYVGAAIHGMHYLFYDRRWDRFETCRTSGALTPERSDLVGEVESLDEARYQAMARLPLIWALVDLNYSELGFIDYGSGRGRLLLTAARFPFREVIGVEFSRSLHQQACENIRNYSREHLACTNIASFHVNALEFDFPDGEWVAFFNPFAENALQRVVQRIVERVRRSNRRIYIVFGNSDRLPALRNLPGPARITLDGLDAVLLRTLAPVPFEFFVVEPEETQLLTLNRKARPPAEQPTHRARART